MTTSPMSEAYLDARISASGIQQATLLEISLKIVKYLWHNVY